MSLEDKIKTYAKQYDLSDFHIRSNQPLALRENGSIVVNQEDIISREDIETFGKAYGISFSESHKQFLERFNGGMIQEYEDYMYTDMTEWEPDGPKWSSFCLFSLDDPNKSSFGF